MRPARFRRTVKGGPQFRQVTALSLACGRGRSRLSPPPVERTKRPQLVESMTGAGTGRPCGRGVWHAMALAASRTESIDPSTDWDVPAVPTTSMGDAEPPEGPRWRIHDTHHLHALP